jgi:hypothetical protein
LVELPGHGEVFAGKSRPEERLREQRRQLHLLRLKKVGLKNRTAMPGANPTTFEFTVTFNASIVVDYSIFVSGEK